MTRAALDPPAANTLHVIGDTHFDVVPNRTTKTQTDLLLPHMAKPAYRIQVGDQTNDSFAAQDTAALAFLTALDVDAIACGNHDLFNGRTIAQWAATYGAFNAAQNYTLDMGFAQLVVIAVTSGLSQPFTLSPATLAWLDATLAAATKDCWILCHYPLYNTARLVTFYGTTDPNWAEDQWRTDTEDVTAMCIYPDLAIAAILNARPAAKVWISGHTHSAIDADGLITVRNVGQWTGALLAAGGYTNMLAARASDFEQATISGWAETHTGTATRNAWEVSSAWANSPTRSLHYSVTANANGTAAQSYMNPTFTGITPGNVYVITMKVNLIQKGAKGPSFAVNWQDGSGVSLSTVRSSSIDALGVSDLTIVCRAPANAAKMFVAFGNDSFGSMQLASGETVEFYIDDAWVVATTDNPPGSRNIIAVNASAIFETGTTSLNRASNKICSLYLTKNDTTIDIRVRNHGAGAWDTIQGRRVTTVAIPD